ncbi:hypothetical protein BSKO_04265 [Bryopsis sp. KO-2023]|nr:hypothetical protein BSKO_04265 [Bryopsis sp. KO-2023]
MDGRSRGSDGRRLSGTPVLMDAWESGLLRRDSVPDEIWESANEKLLSLEAEAAGLDEGKCNAEKEYDQWVAFHKQATKNFEKGMQAYKQEADIQAKRIVEDKEMQHVFEQELMELEKQMERLKEAAAIIGGELSVYEARPVDVEIDDLQRLAEAAEARNQEMVATSSDLDHQLEAMEKENEGIKAESESKDKELRLLYDSLKSLQCRQDNLEAREQQAEMDSDGLNTRERAVDLATAKLNEEKLQAC